MTDENQTLDIQKALQDALVEGRAHLADLRQAVALSPTASGSNYNVPVKGPQIIPARPSGTSGAAVIQPFTIVDASTYDAEGNLLTARIRIVSSTMAGVRPDGFSDGDEPPYLLEVDDSGKLWAVVVIEN